MLTRTWSTVHSTVVRQGSDVADVKFDVNSSALLVIDMQNDFCHPDGVFAAAGFTLAGLDGLVASVNSLATAAREGGRPVIWVRMEWADAKAVGVLAERSTFLESSGLRQGTWGSELVAGLDVKDEDHVLTKTRFSAFYRTELEALLENLGVTSLVMAGVRTDFCVESTARDAFFRDLRVVVVADATASYRANLHDNSLEVLGTVFAQIAQQVDAAQLFTSASPFPSG